MNWPGFYSLSSAWLFLLFIPLLILYFLKLKRPQQEIPSLALWRQVINDQRVNSPFQRFKRNLLLLLQMLLLGLLALAALQPFITSGTEQADYLPVLIDCSASMGAIDQNGQSRLDLAREEVHRLIDDLRPEQRLSLIAVSDTARQLADFTDNKRVLRDALSELEVLDVPARLEDALRMTQAMARTAPIESALMYSDGNFPQDVNFELPYELNFQLIEPAPANIGISSFNARRTGSEHWDVFVRVTGSRDDATACDIELVQDGDAVAEQAVVLEAGESQRLVFGVDASEAASLELRLRPDGRDSLESDNIAFLELPAPRPLEVFCSPELAAFRHALSVLKDITVWPDESGEVGTAKLDVIITDIPLDEDEYVAGLQILVGILPEDILGLMTMETAATEIIDWERSDPLLEHVNMGAIDVIDQPVRIDDAKDADFEQAGYEILTYARTGPLIFKRREGPTLTYAMAFHIDRSTLPYNVGFPVMVGNIIRIALEQASLSEIRGQQTGLLASQRLTPERDYSVESPDGSSRDYESNTAGELRGVVAPHVGRYRIKDGAETVSRVGAGLLDTLETSLAAADQIQFKEIAVEANAREIETDRPLWPLLATLAFIVLLVEWWFFQRRPGGVAA